MGTSAYLSGYDSRVIRLELSRITELLAKMGDPHRHLHYVHLAGTNGKGSTAACLSAILTAAGYRTGLFTSPALSDVTERIQIDGVPISHPQLRQLSDQVSRLGGLMADPPTEFEAVTAVALAYFAQEHCDIVLLEVGLGGREDATNVIPAPEVCVLTAMGLDHTRLLGTTLEEIAAVKAGILKPGTAAVSYGNEPACNQVFRQVCQTLHVPLTEINPARLSQITPSLAGNTFALSPYGTIHLPLLGTYQPQNALLAVTAAEVLMERGWTISPEAIRTGLSHVRWPGRCELLSTAPLFLLDGSHNPHGMAATVQSIRSLLPHIRPVFLLGVMGDKDISEMLRLLLPLASSFVTVTPNHPRALPADQLAQQIQQQGGEAQVAASIKAGVALALQQAGSAGAVCALGTLYFSQDVRQALAQIHAQPPANSPR